MEAIDFLGVQNDCIFMNIFNPEIFVNNLAIFFIKFPFKVIRTLIVPTEFVFAKNKLFHWNNVSVLSNLGYGHTSHLSLTEFKSGNFPLKNDSNVNRCKKPPWSFALSKERREGMTQAMLTVTRWREIRLSGLDLWNSCQSRTSFTHRDLHTLY